MDPSPCLDRLGMQQTREASRKPRCQSQSLLEMGVEGQKTKCLMPVFPQDQLEHGAQRSGHPVKARLLWSHQDLCRIWDLHPMLAYESSADSFCR